MTCFTADNTEGYTAEQLAALNAEFNRRAAGIDEDDKSQLDHIAERVLADFDTSMPEQRA